MRQKITLPLLLCIILITTQCQQNENEKVAPKQFVTLKFETDGGVLTIKNVLVQNGKLISDELQAIKVIYKETGKEVIAYTIKSNSVNARINKFNTVRMYVFTGTCFEYGTLGTDDESGFEAFWPASNTTKSLGFGDICPGDGSAFA